ncbi:hypothetical protein F66182_4043 [Fusarium sp. NRRL 66182]|nr:hypothetical protein F66182_4043 [Fusarium sp. NRRL 66182]
MSTFLDFQWPHPDHPNFICWHRAFDNTNSNSLIALRIPWIQYPPTDAKTCWHSIRDMARQAVQDWAVVLEDKISGEAYYVHQRVTSMIHMNEQLRLTVDSLAGDAEENMLLFYGFAADEVAALPAIRDLKLGRKVVKMVGSGREAHPIAVPRRGKKRSG